MFGVQFSHYSTEKILSSFNLNLMFVAYGATVILQIVLASLSFALIVSVTVYLLILLPDVRPNYTIPSVFTWATVSFLINTKRIG